MNMKRIAAGLGTVALIAAGAVIGFAAPASAHVPDIKASCSGVVLSASAYDGNKENTWEVAIGGDEHSGTFGSDLSETFDVPQAGATTLIMATIADADNTPEYTETLSESVGPCGVVPPVKDASAGSIVVTEATCAGPAVASFGDIENARPASANAKLDQSPGKHWATFIADDGHVFSNGKTSFTEPYTVPVQPSGDDCIVQRGSPSVTVSDRCGVADVLNIPADTENVTYRQKWNADHTHVQVVADAHNGFTFDNGKVLATWEFDVTAGTDCPPQPADEVTTTTGKPVLDCSIDSATWDVTTSTVGYTWNDDTQVWVAGEPVVSVKHNIRNATEAECPTAVVVATPPTSAPVAPVALSSDSTKLADTGSQIDAALIVGGGGLAAGLIVLSIVFWKRRRQITE